MRVALPVPVDRLFDYRLPRAQAEPVATGQRVRVGFAGQPLVGVVVPGDWRAGDDVAEDARPGAGRALAEIEAVIDEEPVVAEGLLRILADAAHELFAPIGLALAHALPPGSTPRLARPWALTDRGERALAQGAVEDRSRTLLEALARGAQTLHALRQRAPGRDPGPQLAELARDGLVERRVELRSARARVPTERLARLAPGVDVEVVARTRLARAPKQAALLERIAAAPTGLPTRPLAAMDRGANATLRALHARGLVLFTERPRLDASETVLDGGERVELSADQEAALGPIRDAVKRQVAETFLLHGVTGSGKTEVYLRAIASALEQGRQALVLVPEITLTHQIVARVRARFGDEVAVLHSGLKPGERLAQWERLRAGETRVAVGARSALFAPLEELGLVVIDEEHDGAYKNEEGFRYHAADLAARRAVASGCPLILGSATPALETRHRADTGEIKRLSLPRRVGGRPLPAVEIVDLAREKKKQARGRKLILSKPLRSAIDATLADGGQTILFLNRRGFSTRIYCFQCGHAERCDDCDVALVFHAGDHVLRCHYCDATRPVPERCNGCGDPETALLGVGTERLEEEVGALFPNARTMRLDRDLAARRGHVESVLTALRDETVDIVIGTQMVAKGHDFPGVQLVGVVAADVGLHLPDFRAAERTFQLVTQVAGRAGRATRPGRVVVQTFVPDHYALAPVASHDYERFYREEVAHRQALGYPPFGRLARVVVHAEVEAHAREATEAIARAARDAVRGEAGGGGGESGTDLEAPGAVEVLGPSPAPIARLRGRFRFMCLFKSGDEPALRRACEATRDVARRLPREVQVALDARPINML